jgi:SAM-dependent methyltransferase
MTPYDAFPYGGRPFEHTHPDRLAAIAALYGMQPAPAARCRVLEVGCGDGANIVPMAHALPGSTFVGLDLASSAVGQARALGAQLGLANLHLHAQDLQAFDPQAGAFDYIVVHGLYSWVPAAVRDALMALIARHLAPDGVAFVSYNVYPGCYARRMLWDAMKFQAAGIEDPETRVSEARALAQMIASEQPSEANVIQKVAAELVKREAAYILHDDLADTNEPCYFHEFVAHAAAHGLQFLAEAELGAMGLSGTAPDVRRVLEQMDVITREQYLDFLRCRRFRQTLLCRSEVELKRTGLVERLMPLHFGVPARIRLAEDPPSMQPDAAERARLRTLLDALSDAAPTLLDLPRLNAAVDVAEGRGVPAHDLARLLLGAVFTGAVTVHASTASVAPAAGERPLASALARAQCERGNVITNLRHQPVRLDDDVALDLLRLLDGSRTRAQLLALLGVRLGAEAGRPAALESHLATLARLGLLSA